MDIINLQILANEKEADKRDGLIESLESISYFRIEKAIDEDLDIVDVMSEDRSDIVLVFEHFQSNGYLVSQKITNNYPSKSVILIKSDRSQANIREIVRSGASDIVPYDVDLGVLTDMIYSTYQTNLKKQEAIKSEEDRLLAQEGKLFTVFSTKGGIGKTFFSTNLAASLAKDKSKRVVLVDLDLEYGGIGMSYNIDAETSIMDAVEDTLHLDSDLLESYLVKHKSGVHVLVGSTGTNMGEYINSDQVEIIVNTLKQSFDYVVVDMPGRFMEAVNPAFTYAHTVFLLTAPEVLSLKNTRSALNVFQDLDYPMSKVKVILNKVSFGGISRRDVETTLEHEVFAEIPEDTRRVRNSQNSGRPYVNLYRKSAVTKAFDSIVSDSRIK